MMNRNETISALIGIFYNVKTALRAQRRLNRIIACPINYIDCSQIEALADELSKTCKDFNHSKIYATYLIYRDDLILTQRKLFEHVNMILRYLNQLDRD